MPVSEEGFVTELQIANCIASLFAAFAAAYLGQQWLDDRNLSFLMREVHRIMLLILCCVLVAHAVYPGSLLCETLLALCAGIMYTLRIIARWAVDHRRTWAVDADRRMC
jgi:hypothetical protein